MCFQVAELCYQMLHLLSENNHVAAKMAKSPSFQATLVRSLEQLLKRKHREEERQQSNWNAAPAKLWAKIWATSTETGSSSGPVDRKGTPDTLFDALHVLTNILQATRRAVSTGEKQEHAPTFTGYLRFLYRESHCEEAEGDKGGKEVSRCHLNWDLVADIAELVVNPHASGSERVSTHTPAAHIWLHQA